MLRLGLPSLPPARGSVIQSRIFARHNAGAALSLKSMFKPTKEFHTARHRINFELGMLDFEFNQLSDFQFQHFLPVVPVAASVKTKLGRGGTGEE